MESAISSAQLLISCVIIGYILSIVTGIPHDEFAANAGFYYWVIIDMLLMISIHAYFYISMLLQLMDNIYMNINSLIFIQSKQRKKEQEEGKDRSIRKRA